MAVPSLLIWLGVVAGLGVVVLAVAGGVLGGGSQGEKAATLDKYTAGVKSFEITTTASGELEAKRQVEVRSHLDSKSTIVEIVSEGTRVKKGDVLVKLNSDALKSQIDDESLRVETARADLVAAREAKDIQESENASDLRKANLKLELAQLSLQQWKDGEDAQKKLDLNLEMDRTERELERLTKKNDQSQQLLAEGFLSQDEADRDALALEEAKAARQKAVLAKETYLKYQYPKDLQQKQSDVQEAEAELDRVKRQNHSQMASKDADLLNKQRQFELHHQKLDELQQQLEAATIKAPSDGLVVYSTSMDRNRWRGGSDGPWQIGSDVYPNQLIIVLPDTTEMIASVQVHESLVGRVKPGQHCTVKIDALGGHVFQGSVMDIGVLAETGGWRDPNRREYTVRIALTDDESGAKLKPSMRCEGEIVLGRVEDALTVPIQAVFSEGMLQYVYVVSGDKFARRPVRVGRRSDRFAEIAAGLDSGERVLLRQPSAGEVLDQPYTDEELAAVGLRKDENGKIERAEPRAAKPGGRHPHKSDRTG